MINPHFVFDDCVFIDNNKAVIFSPATLETLLCDISVADFLLAWLKNDKQRLYSLPFKQRIEIIDKLKAMQILLQDDRC